MGTKLPINAEKTSVFKTLKKIEIFVILILFISRLLLTKQTIRLIIRFLYVIYLVAVFLEIELEMFSLLKCNLSVVTTYIQWHEMKMIPIHITHLGDTVQQTKEIREHKNTFLINWKTNKHYVHEKMYIK